MKVIINLLGQQVVSQQDIHPQQLTCPLKLWLRDYSTFLMGRSIFRGELLVLGSVYLHNIDG